MSLPAVVVVAILIVKKGAALGMKTLYVVVATLFVSLAMFFLGRSAYEVQPVFGTLLATVDSPAPLFLVFAITFPAFTGMTAGVGLSGDLSNPKRSIPVGTLAATLGGMVVYVLVALKLALSAPRPTMLASDQLVMSRIALWGPIIPIGLAAAALSSAIGSFLVAPRTLQAIAERQGLSLAPHERVARVLQGRLKRAGRTPRSSPPPSPSCSPSPATSTSSPRSSPCSS